jgi:hypothetical protein
MKRLACAAALAVGAVALLVVACGRYGSPHRPKPAPAAASVPVTDPSVPR